MAPIFKSRRTINIDLCAYCLFSQEILKKLFFMQRLCSSSPLNLSYMIANLGLCHKNTTQAILRLIDFIVESLDDRYSADEIFLDLSKAFDTSDHL